MVEKAWRNHAKTYNRDAFKAYEATCVDFPDAVYAR